MKKAVSIVGLAIALSLFMEGAAYANFGPHRGGFDADTDACAGCHRAHSSFSDVMWTDQAGYSHSALLIAGGDNMDWFCLACHGDGAPGASTNVVSGLFDGGPSGSYGQVIGDDNAGVTVSYQTVSTFGELLNGGGFTRVPMGGGVFKDVTSLHNTDEGALTDPMWGAGFSAPAGENLSCTDCHDPHGSSNYRLLKDKVNDHKVGGYTSSGTPEPWVISRETSYPAVGWLRHQAGAAQLVGYTPNYTAAEYAWVPNGLDESGTPVVRSISGWCSACHEQYDETSSTYNYNRGSGGSGWYATDGSNRRLGEWYKRSGADTDVVGARVRHRHPVGMTINVDSLAAVPVTSTYLPLEVPLGSALPRGTWDVDSYVGCLTCHRAHGTSADMTGWAEASLVASPSAPVTWYPERSVQPTVSGVNPNFTSALLRRDNRGVCERCHNK